MSTRGHGYRLVRHTQLQPSSNQAHDHSLEQPLWDSRSSNVLRCLAEDVSSHLSVGG